MEYSYHIENLMTSTQLIVLLICFFFNEALHIIFTIFQYIFILPEAIAINSSIAYPTD